MLSGFWHEKNIIASMVHACDIIKSNTKIQTHKLCKESPILHELKCDFSTNNLNIYYTYKMKSVSWIIDKIRCSFMFQPRRKQLTFIPRTLKIIIIYFTPCLKKQCSYELWIIIELEILFVYLMFSLCVFLWDKTHYLPQRDTEKCD